jgi:hypothetical protein
LPKLILMRSVFLKQILTIALCCLAYNYASGQGITGPVGARAWMLGGSSAADANVWSAANNVAGTTQVKNLQAGLYTEQRFNEANLRLTNFSMVVPTKYVNLGGSVNYYGYTAFNQQRLSLSVARALNPIFSLGIQLNYVSTFIEDYGQTGNTVIGAGLYIKPMSRLALGFSIFNPTQNRYGKYTEEKIPSYGKLGCVYDVSDKIVLHAETDQRLNQKLIWRGGIYYKIHGSFHLAMGMATNPTYYTFGTSLHLKKIKLDMASSFHEVLGFTPHIAISLQVVKK